MAVINRSEVLFWELMPLEGTHNWRDYVNIATHRGLPLVLFVQAFDKGGSSSQIEEEVHVHQDTTQQEATEDITNSTHGPNEDNNDEGHEGVANNPPREATREIDEGEVNPDIVARFERENDDHTHAVDDDSSEDEKESHVPHDWSTYEFSNLSVHEREAVAWEYRENEVCLGALYRSGDDVKEAIKRWSTLSLQRQFRVLKSSPHIYEVCCVKSKVQNSPLIARYCPLLAF